MKRLWTILILVLLCAAVTCGWAAASETTGEDNQTTSVEQGNNEKAGLSENGQYYYYNRVVDISETLTKDERIELSQYIFTFMDAVQCDLQIYFIRSVEAYGYETMDAFADYCYMDEKYPAGYGAEGTAVILVYELDKNLASVTYFGDVPRLTQWAVLKARLLFEYYVRFGDPYDGCKLFIDRIWKELDATHTAGELRTDLLGPENFRQFNNENIARVLDYGEILSETAEAEMLARVEKFRKETGVDIVVVTVPETDGKDLVLFADNFYDYAGFGGGSECDGVMLLVDMNPNVRDYTIITTGRGISYFTDAEIDGILDGMLDYFAAGKFEDGVNYYIDQSIFQINDGRAGEGLIDEFNGIKKEDIKPVDDDADRVIDPSGVLKDSEKDSLEEMIREIREAYDMDVLVLLPESNVDYSAEVYLRLYYEYMGYGVGNSRSGIGLLINPTSWKDMSILVFGDAGERFDASALDRLTSMTESSLGGSINRAQAANTFVKKVRFYCKWKHFPMSWGGTIFVLIVAYLVFSGIGALKKASNKTVAQAVTASEYLVPGSRKIFHVNERFLNSKVSKTRKPEPSSSSGSRSGGGGSSVHHGSSGVSHGGGGRRHF